MRKPENNHTLFTLIVAVAFGVSAGVIVFNYHDYARTHWASYDGPIRIKQPTKEDLAYFESWQQKNNVTIDESYYYIDPEFVYDQTLVTVCEKYSLVHHRRFWYRLTTSQLTGIAFLWGIGIAVPCCLFVWAFIRYLISPLIKEDKMKYIALLLNLIWLLIVLSVLLPSLGPEYILVDLVIVIIIFTPVINIYCLMQLIDQRKDTNSPITPQIVT